MHIYIFIYKVLRIMCENMNCEELQNEISVFLNHTENFSKYPRKINEKMLEIEKKMIIHLNNNVHKYIILFL